MIYILKRKFESVMNSLWEMLKFHGMQVRNVWTASCMRKELYHFFCPPLSLVQNCSSATNTCLITSISFFSVALLVVCFIFKKETDLIIWIMWPVVWLPPFKTQVIKVQTMSPRNAPYISHCLSLVPAGAK